MMNQTSGDAVINGLSIKTEMSAIRANLGICPQFDVLWPNLTVKEHLTLYASFAGMPKHMIPSEVGGLLRTRTRPTSNILLLLLLLLLLLFLLLVLLRILLLLLLLFRRAYV
jgi:ABC-type sugar transport system ATPase subunit